MSEFGRIARFIVTGVFNTAVAYLLFVSLLYVGITTSLALAIATVLGAIFNFWSIGKFAFRSTPFLRLPHFLAIYAALYMLNLFLLNMLQINFGIGPATAQFLCIFVIAPSTYVLVKKFVYRHNAGEVGE